MGWKNLSPERGMLPDDFPEAPVVVLVRPQMGENIGMAARAMLNCGMTEMRIVAPRDGWPNEAATANASGASLVIENAEIYNTLPEALADCSFVLATTARDRYMVKPVFAPDSAAEAVISEQQAGRKCALLFGAERSGLENDELTLADGLITVPLNPAFSSLNLAQAVLLVCYQWYARVGAAVTGQNDALDVLRLGEGAPATKDEVQLLVDHMVDELDGVNFFNSEEIRPTIILNLSNMFTRMRLTVQEARTFHGMIKAFVGRTWQKRKD